MPRRISRNTHPSFIRGRSCRASYTE
ncbi:hypothetical protein GQ600_16690 [Phytophthora cactorum]|nr:hypothetical protein GQ600_16690 [Phytophthora cactorum]